MDKRLIENLTKVKASLTEHTWIRNHMALDADGNDVQPEDARACKCCLAGAVIHSVPGRGPNSECSHVFNCILSMLNWKHGTTNIPWFNDTLAKSLDDVHALIDAITVEASRR